MAGTDVSWLGQTRRMGCTASTKSASAIAAKAAWGMFAVTVRKAES